MRPLVLLSISFATAALADAQIISPVAYATREGNSGTTRPWGHVPIRFQQIHADLRGSARTIKALAHRRDMSTFGRNTNSRPRTYEVQMWAGHGQIRCWGNTYLKNYVGARRVVFTKKNLSLPDWRPRPSRTPAPFSLRVVFDNPFAYNGRLDLVWEVAITRPTIRSVHFTDLATLNRTANVTGTKYGTGCRATGRTRRMDISLTGTQAIRTYSMTWRVTDCLANGRGAIMLGVRNPALSIPGLCTRLYTSPIVSLSRRANSSGVMSVAVRSNQWVVDLTKAELFAQGVILDSRKTPFPVSASNGVRGAVAYPVLTNRAAWLFHLGNVSAPTGNPPQYSIGVVTRFDT